MTTYSLRDTATGYGSGTSVSLTMPATIQAHDTLLYFVSTNGTPTHATGWQALANPSSWVATTTNQLLAWRPATASDAGATLSISTTTANASRIILWAIQGPVSVDITRGMLVSRTGSTASGTYFGLTARVGDLGLWGMNAYVTGSTCSATGTLGTVANDGIDTTSTLSSARYGHISYTSAGSNANGTFAVSPAGTQGWASFIYIFGDYTVSAAAGGQATCSPPAALTAAAGGQAKVVIPLGITGVTAIVTGLAPATGAAVGTSAPPSVVGVTALVAVDAEPPSSFDFDGGDITLLGETAEVTWDADEGIVFIAGTAPLGDNFTYPFQVGGSGGTVTITTDTFTVETDEPAPVWPTGAVAGDRATELFKTAWVRYVGTQAGTLTITGDPSITSDAYEIELFEGSSLDNLTLLDSEENIVVDPIAGTSFHTPVLTEIVGANAPVYLRLWPTFDFNTDITVTLTFSFVPDANPGGTLGFNIITPTFSVSPGVIRADVIGGTPDGNMVFDLLGTTATYSNPTGVGLGNGVATYTADTSGNLYGASIPLPTVSAGTYTLRVTDSGTGYSAVGTIQVEADPISPPGTIPSDNPIGSVSNGTTVKKWVFRDPAPSGLGTYVFTINPATMTSPHAERNVTVDHLVAADAAQIIWEGAYRANEWQFQGIVLEQADYDSIVGFAALNRRFWIVDHRDRAWVCSIESISWAKHRDPSNDWAWDYDITALIYEGPTSI